ncbi:MAG: hypothetical protein OXH23_05620 [bacterium]|nr:hypothetical protein [bacterium]
MSEMNALGEQYLEICDDLISKIGTENVGFVVPEDASLEQCASYLEQFVVHDREHFRYCRYLRMLAHCSEQHGSLGTSAKGDRTIVHVDVGTGPGVFHWVMHDCIQQQFELKHRPQLMLFGYDKCPNMLELAKRIWKEFDVEVQPNYFSDAKELVKTVKNVSPNAHLIVTFGHVLIQANKVLWKPEIAKLAKLCGKLSNSTHTTDIIAADAYAYDYSNQFNRAASRLFKELQKCSDKGQWRQVDISDSILPDGSRALIRNWGES